MPRPGARAPASRPGPLLVKLRWHWMLAFAGVLALMAVILLRLLRTDLDEDDFSLVLVLAVACFWLLALGLGTLARTFFAGHALRLDEAGLHLPGWDTVPWSAIQRAGLRHYVGPLNLPVNQLELWLDAGCTAPSRGSYERWLWGPYAGLRRGKKDAPIRVPLFAFHVSHQELLSRIEAHRQHAAAARARP